VQRQCEIRLARKTENPRTASFTVDLSPLLPTISLRIHPNYQATVMHDTSSADKGYAGKEVTAGGTRIRPFKSNLTFCVVCDCVFTLQTDEWCLHNQIFALIESTM
jgi:hypothetical protein